MQTAKIILNPYAGRWKARRARPAIERACRTVGLNYELVSTSGPGEAITLAREAVRAGFSPVVAAGGDGTIGEVLNGLMTAAEQDGRTVVPLGIIPLGSADDFATVLGLDRDITAACRTIKAGHTRRVDVGRVNGRYFDNNAAIGLEPVVTITQAAIRHVHGTPRYVLAALKAIFSFTPWHMRIAWDSGEYEGTVTLLSVGNTRRTGGAFLMTPQAEPDDGLLDFIVVRATGRLRLLRLLPSAFDGSHIGQPEVTYGRTTRLTVECTPPTPVHADGEVFDRAVTGIEFTVLPGRLPVLTPPV